MEVFMNNFYDYITTFQPLIKLLVAIVLIIIGVMMVIPNEKIKEFAKGHIPWVVIGCGVVLGAMTFAEELSEKFVF